jgi:tetratricopeptide (TPR) repeat protein
MPKQRLIFGLLVTFLCAFSSPSVSGATESDSKAPPVNLNDWAAVRALGLAKLDALKLKSADKYLNIARTLAAKKSTSSEEFFTSMLDLARLDEIRGRYWPACREYDQVYTNLSQKPGSADDVKGAGLLADLGRLNYILGDLPQARMKLEQALVVFNKANDQSLKKAQLLRDLCQVHLDFALFDRARSEAEQALQLSQKLAGSKSLETCQSLISLARVELFSAQLAQAENYIRQAMAIAVDNSRAASLARANCLDTCAQIYLSEGRSAQALTLEEEALAIRQKILGEDHPSTGESLITLAVISIAQKDYSSAKVFLEKATTIAQDRFGPESAKAAEVLAIQGTCTQREGSSDQAKESFDKASTIAHKLSDLDNPLVKNLRSLVPEKSDPSQAFWQSKKSDTSFAIDPMARCITCLLNKGTIEAPEPPKQPQSVLATVAEPSPQATAAAPQASGPSQDSINSNLKKIKYDRKFLWIAGIIVIPIVVLVFVTIFSNFFRSLKSSVRRPERRAPGKAANASQNAGEDGATKEGSTPLMGRYVDENKVNKMWDINQ